MPLQSALETREAGIERLVHLAAERKVARSEQRVRGAAHRAAHQHGSNPMVPHLLRHQRRHVLKALRVGERRAAKLHHHLRVIYP